MEENSLHIVNREKIASNARLKFPTIKQVYNSRNKNIQRRAKTIQKIKTLNINSMKHYFEQEDSTKIINFQKKFSSNIIENANLQAKYKLKELQNVSKLE